MFPGQRKLRCVVIERRAGPLNGGVTRVAGRGEARIFMVRIHRGIELRLVAIHTRGWGAGKLAILMTRSAFDTGVFSSQGEAGLAMIELRASPLYGCVTGLALRGEIGRPVIRILGRIEIRQVAPDAGGGSGRKSPVYVARNTGGTGVCARQRESGERSVIERCALPLKGRMARFASHRETGLGMVRIGGLGEIRLMATDARGR